MKLRVKLKSRYLKTSISYLKKMAATLNLIAARLLKGNQSLFQIRVREFVSLFSTRTHSKMITLIRLENPKRVLMARNSSWLNTDSRHLMTFYLNFTQRIFFRRVKGRVKMLTSSLFTHKTSKQLENSFKEPQIIILERRKELTQ